MKKVDTSVFVSEQKASRIKPEEIDMADLPPIPKPVPHDNKSQEQEKAERISERTEFRTENRSDQRPSFFPLKRRTTRYSFEFYEDQIYKLKELKHRAEMSGEKVTLSDIAREALDEYLKEKDP
ncbi:MAG: hypothetical protein KJ065_04460 [Anaerolineae bacterium]|nr:hypothetical protein [Anaerolineae bacterium]